MHGYIGFKKLLSKLADYQSKSDKKSEKFKYNMTFNNEIKTLHCLLALSNRR